MGEGALEGKGDHGGAISGDEGVGVGGLAVAVRERGGENDCTLFNSSLTLSLTWFVNEDNDNSYEDYWTKGKLIGNYKIH